MKILTNFTHNSQILKNIINRKNNNITFCNALKHDTFEKSENPSKKILIKDLDNNLIEAQIEKENQEDLKSSYIKAKDVVQYIFNINNNQYGYSICSTNKDENSLILEQLYTRTPKMRQYKNAGTELLKKNVEESIKRGLKGKIELTASHFPPPFVFYYKNNFHVVNSENMRHCSQRFNAAIDYAARNNISISNVIPADITSLSMELNESEAKALLENKRLYEDRIFKTIKQKKFKHFHYSINFIQSPYQNEYFFQVINDDLNSRKQVIVITAHLEEDEQGKKYFKIIDIDDDCCYDENILDWLLKEINKYSKENNMTKYKFT